MTHCNTYGSVPCAFAVRFTVRSGLNGASPLTWSPCGSTSSQLSTKLRWSVRCGAFGAFVQKSITGLPQRSSYATNVVPKACNNPPAASRFAVWLGLCTCFAAVMTLVPMVLLHPFILTFDRKRRDLHERLALWWLRVSFALARIRVHLNGRQNLGAFLREGDLHDGHGKEALFVANCQSPIDMFALAYIKRPMRFIVPEAALKTPLIGWVMQLARWVGVRGADRRSQMQVLKDITAVLEQGGSVCMFPEGGPSPTGGIRPFPSAAFRAAKKAGVQVVPLTVHGTGSMFAHPKAVVPSGAPPGGVHVTVHAPIPPDAGDEKEIANLAFEAVRGALPKDSGAT